MSSTRRFAEFVGHFAGASKAVMNWGFGSPSFRWSKFNVLHSLPCEHGSMRLFWLSPSSTKLSRATLHIVKPSD